MRILVAGAGGFIGHHLVARLKAAGHWVRGADLKRPEFAPTAADEFKLLDLRDYGNCCEAVRGVEWVFQLAADMGGAGFVFTGDNDAAIIRNNTLINANMIEAPSASYVLRYLFTSSACVYPQYRQSEADSAPLREADAYPALPDSVYGWEKLHGEHLCAAYRRNAGLETRVARLHNVYGPLGAWTGGREKAPAALCRKVAEAKLHGADHIDIWGDGQQVRSFLYVNDAVEGLLRLMESDVPTPLNLGSDRAVGIDALARIVMDAAGVSLRLEHTPGPEGVRTRNADISRARDVLDWEPRVSLEDGIARTYAWVEAQVAAQARVTP